MEKAELIPNDLIETIKTYEHHAKYYETDQMGIIHHSNFIRWMEEARVDLMNQMGFSYKEMEDMGIISPVLGVSCEYRNMVHFDDTILIDIVITKYNGIKLELEYQMTDKKTGALCAVGKSAHCFINREGMPLALKKYYPMIHDRFMRVFALLKRPEE